MTTETIWDVEISDSAQEDFDKALLWTRKRFGSDQEESYRRLLAAGLRTLTAGPLAQGVRRQDIEDKSLFVLRPRLGRRWAMHFVVFRLATDGRAIYVLRILHVKMDLSRHLAPD